MTAKAVPANHDDEMPHHVGHRSRLKSRFLDGGADALPDYEMLELLLYLGIPRRDVKPLAKDLLKRFGDFGGVMAATPADLLSVDGMGESAVVALKSVASAAQRMMRLSVLNQPVLNTWDALLSYCHAMMAHEKIEQFRVLYLNRKNHLIADEVHQKGTIDQAAVFPREIVKRALELAATALVLVHNHPSGDPKPSDADVILTANVIGAAKPLGIVVHDHVIIAKSGHLSFKAHGLL